LTSILIELAETQVTLAALTHRASDDPEIGAQEVELFIRRNSLITDLVAAEHEYQQAEALGAHSAGAV
jgi:hypothetical protein